MKKTLMLALLLALAAPGHAQDDKQDGEKAATTAGAKKGDSLVKSVSGAVSGAVQSGKDIIRGMKLGWDEGRQEGTSIDGAVIINDGKFKDHVALQIFSVKRADHVYYMEMGIRNKTDQIVRLTNLAEKSNLQLLDKERYVAYARDPENDITVPKSATIKHTFRFSADGLVSDAQILRLYEQDIVLNQNPEQKTETENKPQ